LTAVRIRSDPSTGIRPPARGDRVGIALLVGSALTLGGMAGEYVTSGGIQLWLANGGWTAGGLTAVIGVAAAAGRSEHRDRVGWQLLLGGCVLWLVGELFWTVYSATSYPASPNPADVCWLAFALAAGAGVSRLVRGPLRSRVVSLLELAPLIVAVSALVVALLTPQLRTSQLTAAGQITSLAYPVFYVSSAMVIFQAALAGARDVRRDPGVIAVLAGITVSAVGFLLWSPQLLTGSYMVGTDAIDALWGIGPILIGVGAWAARPSAASPERDPVRGRWGGVLPALTFVVLAAVQIAANADDGGADLALSVGISVVGVTLIAHAAVLRRHEGTLVAQLHARDRELQDANILLDDTNRLLRQQSRTDTLTGLGNRLRLSEDFTDLAAQAKRHDRGYCLILVDLDHFKAYNDDHGHQAGDLVLAQVAEILSQTLRQTDQAYRYGGEELLLVLRDQHLQAGHTLAERHRAQVQGAALPHSLNPPHEVVTLSAGVAAAHPGDTPEQVLHRADQALYEAKALGRNRVVVSDPATKPSRPPVIALPHA
jgi:diguanylate cyclase (GGDEF)-like protein